MSSNLKTVFLLALLSFLMLFMGQAMGGKDGLMIAFIFALAVNIGSYWFSDKIVIASCKARIASYNDHPKLIGIVDRLAKQAGAKMPRVYIVPDSSPNAFATGRNQNNAAIAVTEGLLELLSPEELEGVLAHEMGHIVNKDILIQTIAGVLATCIMYLSSMLKWTAIFGGRRSNDNNGGGEFIGALAAMIIAPIAATLIQFSISRSREFLADETGARICNNPKALASALKKLSMQTKLEPSHTATQATAHMYIVNPFAEGFKSLFSTHPPVEERVERLMNMNINM